MDVLDAGVYVSKWDAAVPRDIQMVLWGPLQAKEMGLEGWDVQDGGETGFVLHHPGLALPGGRAAGTLIVVRRLSKAFLTTYLGGYPADVPAPQRRLDHQKLVSEAELFLSRLARSRVSFEFRGELSLVDNVNDAVIEVAPRHALPSMPGPEHGHASGSAHGAASSGYSPSHVWEV